MEKLLLNEREVLFEYEKIKNIHKIAKQFNVSITPIKRILTKNGIILTNRRYFVDENYFNNIDTEEKAYWLGFIFADGYTRERKSGNSLELKLSIKDKKHLELFKQNINSNHLITNSTNKVKYKDGISQSSMCHLAIYSRTLVESIKKHGVHPRKTFTIKFPNIKEELQNHFIRGYFDGDGSFSFIPEKYKITTNIVCASNEFRNDLVEILKKNDIWFKQYSNIKIEIQNKLDCLKFYNYIYKNATIFLNRKKEKYEEFRKYYEYNN